MKWIRIYISGAGGRAGRIDRVRQNRKGMLRFLYIWALH